MKLLIKKQQIISTSKNLFYKHGIKKISVEEICHSAHVSKMTFYKYFRNKSALVEYLVDELFNDGYSKFHHIFTQDITLEEKFKKWFVVKMEYSQSMSKEFYMELNHFNRETFEKIQEKNNQMQSEVMEYLNESRLRGEITPGVSMEFISYILNHFIIIVDDPKFSSMYHSLEAMTKDISEFLLYGLFGKKC